MHTFRVPYPREPERREILFRRAAELIARYGMVEGTAEAGAFHGSTPIGKFAGAYSCVEGADEVEIVLKKKPWILSMGLIESEARKFVARA